MRSLKIFATNRSGHAHALGVRRFIAANNRCVFGVRAALPELVLIYEP